MGHEQIETTMGYYRVPQKRRRDAAEIVGNLVIDGDACWPSLRVTTTEELCVAEGEDEQSGECAAAW